ncbi:hypothetical protein ABFB50_00990, partial [Dehalococcoides sp. THU3]
SCESSCDLSCESSCDLSCDHSCESSCESLNIAKARWQGIGESKCSIIGLLNPISAYISSTALSASAIFVSPLALSTHFCI